MAETKGKSLRCAHCSRPCDLKGGPVQHSVATMDIRLPGYDLDDPKTWHLHYGITTCQTTLAKVVADVRRYLDTVTAERLGNVADVRRYLAAAAAERLRKREEAPPDA